jgi:hypothetical protein
MRSRPELLEASGYATRTRDFDDLIRILDPELRLITPTDPEGTLSEDRQITASGQYYVLSHDYLVHSLRDWLTRKQRETRRGRAELVLEDRYALWKQERARLYLPTLGEAVAIMLYVGFFRLQTDKRQMVRSALVERASHAMFYMFICGIIFVLFNFLRMANENSYEHHSDPPIIQLTLTIIMVIWLCLISMIVLFIVSKLLYKVYVCSCSLLEKWLLAAKK